MQTKLDVEETVFPLAEVFTISRGSRTQARTVTVTLTQGAHIGQGECVPYARYGETVDSVIAQITSLSGALSEGLDRQGLQQALPAGAARNALDCAFWDLEAKIAGRRAFELAALAEPVPVQTAFTLSLDDPQVMREKAQRNAHRPLLKIKLGGEGDLERLEAVRVGAPRTAIIVDANEGWSAQTYADLAPELLRLGVTMVEQPLPAGEDDALADMDRPLPVCADESCHDRASLVSLRGKYDMVNIKLDKTGGLTEALELKEEATAGGLAIMVGCMVASSLAMAPAVLVAQGADIVDLDGPLLLAADQADPLLYDASGVHPPSQALWG
ncbi:N-acetyl-D-Glu racemase DgcA [Hoeflea prorocentri]|uniref:Dipeptide epimerase n=1 Tax=Hoeflea prorocentri TaxID=1922333 RepID=A0A9X3UH78_9HYPH|nr:N-acetyl-D-Glu racemase DgcA [Hoeflea prorocentri]MCY6381287.1 dipeptide epimerase [Hoeflea prorocentri]MDA5399087.1 dipeptide epimerase [Hoeflea prorocentri]